MVSKITREDITEFLKAGRSFLGSSALDSLGKSLNQMEKDIFNEAIEIGIEKTIAALYAANVPDIEILHIVCAQWSLTIEEVECRLVWEKTQATIRSLCQHLRLQGYSLTEINQFMRNNRALPKIRHDKELWKLRKNPQKLMKAVQEK